MFILLFALDIITLQFTSFNFFLMKSKNAAYIKFRRLWHPTARKIDFQCVIFSLLNMVRQLELG